MAPPSLPMRSSTRMGQASRTQIAGDRLRRVDRRIRIAYECQQNVRDIAARDPAMPEQPRHADLIDRAAIDHERPHPLGHQRPHLDLAAPRRDHRPPRIVDAERARELWRHLDEPFRLQLRRVRRRTRPDAAAMQLRQPIGRKHIGIVRIIDLVQLVAGPRPDLGRGIALLVRVERVARRAFGRLVMRRQRPVQQAGRHEQHRLAIRLHDERIVTPERVHALRMLREIGPIRRLLGRHEVGHVEPGPFLLAFVPPHHFLLFGPGISLRIRRRAVVESAPVGRPGPRPVEMVRARVRGRVRAPRTRPVIPFRGIDAAIDPAATGRAAVILQIREVRNLLAIGHRVAVDLAQDRFRVRLLPHAAHRILPGQRLNRPIARQGAVGVELLQPAAEMEDEMQVRAAVARRLERRIVPLHQPLGVGDRAVLLAGQCRRQQEHLGPDLRRLAFAALDQAPLAPEIGGFHERHVAHDQPFELAEPDLGQVGVDRAHQRVLPEDEPPLHHPRRHRQRHRLRRHVTGQLRQELVAVLVLRRRIRAIPGLQQAHDVFRHVVPPARRRRLGLEIRGQRVVMVEYVGLRQVGRQHVVQRRDVGAALDARMSPQRHDAAAGPPHVAEQRLHDRGGADDLHAHRGMRPADRVADGTRALAPRVPRHRLGDSEKRLLRTTRDLLDHLGRVAGIMPLHDLIDAVRMLQRRIARRRAVRHRLEVVAGALFRLHAVLGHGRGHDLALVLPAIVLVALRVHVEAREQPVKRLRIGVGILDDVRDVRVGHHVVAEPQVALEDLVDHPTQERDVRSRTQRRMDVGQCGRPREPRIGMDDGGPTLLRLHDEAEPDRMILRHVRAHDEHGIGVGQIPQRHGGGAASEGGTQTGHRRGVSNAGLVLDADDSQPSAEQLLDEVVFLVVQRRPAERSDAHRVVHAPPVWQRLDERLVTRFLGQLRDPLHRPIERPVLPRVGVRRAILHRVDARWRQQHPQCAGTFRAERSLVDRRARIALDMDRIAALRIYELRATDRAERAHAGAHRIGLLEPRPQIGRTRALRTLRIRALPRELARQRPVAQEVLGPRDDALAQPGRLRRSARRFRHMARMAVPPALRNPASPSMLVTAARAESCS